MSAFETDPFFQYARTPVATSEGNVDLPFVDDASVFSSGYWIDFQRAQALVVDTGFEAVRFENGKGADRRQFLRLSQHLGRQLPGSGNGSRRRAQGWPRPDFRFYLCSETWIKFEWASTSSTFRSPRPLPTSRAGKFGPAQIRDLIDFARNGERFEIRVTDPNAKDTILKFSGEGGVGAPGPLFDAVLLSSKDGKILRTIVTTKGGAKIPLRRVHPARSFR